MPSYKNNLAKNINSATGCDFENKTIWAFWGNGEKNLPSYERANLHHWREMVGNDWRIVVTSMDPTDPYYIYNNDLLEKDDLPNIIETQKIELRRYKSTLSPAILQSDFIRLALLQKYSGIWMDVSIIMNRSPDEMTIIKDFLASDKSVLAYCYEASSKLKLPIRYFENSFIAVKNRNDPLIVKINEYMRALYENKLDGTDIAEESMFKDKAIFDIEGKKYPLSYFWGDASERNYLSMYAVIQLIAHEYPGLYQNHVHLKSAKGSENGAFNLSDVVGGFENIELASHRLHALIKDEKLHIDLVNKLLASDMIKIYGALRKSSVSTMTLNELISPHNLIGKLWERSLKRKMVITELPKETRFC